MKKQSVIKRVLRKMVSLIGYERVERVIQALIMVSGVSSERIFYATKGILKFRTSQESGESWFLQTKLPQYINPSKAVMFDVGANVGEYSEELRLAYPTARIFAFEPNPASYQILCQRLAGKQINFVPLGLGSLPAKLNMYLDQDQATSTLASIYPEVISGLHGAKNQCAIGIELTTLDEFTARHGIERIHFLKIDIEGNELAALQGSRRMLTERRIDVIQFEFNEMNVYSRVFLKDFYDLLGNYNIYRLDTKNLIPLGQYNTRHEIFKFQNIIAIPKELDRI